MVKLPVGRCTVSDLNLDLAIKNQILKSFLIHNRNLSRTARALDISLDRLKRHLKTYGMTWNSTGQGGVNEAS